MGTQRSSTLHRLIVQAVEKYKAETKLSYKDIAEQCRISPSQFSEILSLKSRLSAEQIEKICLGLGVTLQEIVNKDIIEGQIKPKFPDLDQEEYEAIAKAVALFREQKHRRTLLELIDAMHEVFLHRSE